LLDAVVGWEGVRLCDVLPDASAAEPLEWSPDAVALYLDARPDDADAMGAELLSRVGQRNAQIEADAKN
jgi:hypothetical protein